MGEGSHRYVKSDNGSEQVYCECLKRFGPTATLYLEFAILK